MAVTLRIGGMEPSSLEGRVRSMPPHLGIGPDRRDGGGRGRISICHSAGLIATAILLAAGCSDPKSLELVGDELRRRIPEELTRVLPPDAVLCLDETAGGEKYRLWILRRPGGTWLHFPKKLPGFEQHNMPPATLESVLTTKLPSLTRGRPIERRCRYTHWHGGGGTEFQTREIITDQGWFASVEQFRP